MSTQPSTSDAPPTTSTTPAAPTSTDPTVTTSTPPVEAPSSTAATSPPSSESPSTSTPSTPSTSKTDKQSKRTSLVKTFFKKLRDSSPNQRKPMSSSSKPTNAGTAPLNGEAPLSGSGAILENKDAEKNAGNLSGSVDPTTATTGDAATQAPGAGIVDQSHPGQIIPHTEKKHPGEEPVQVQPVRNPYYGGVLNEVDVLVTKEAEKIMQAMSAMVENSANVGGGSGDIPLNVRDTLYPHSGSTAELGFPKKKWFENWASGMLDKLFAAHRMGVYVITDRKTKANIFETMPIFTRLGMHLLFVSTNHEILDLRAVEGLFKDVSFRQGKIYDNPDPAFVIPHIEAFIQAYNLKVDDLLEPDIKKYKTFNDFFKRSLKPGARPVQEANDLSVITSPADSRVTVFKSVGDAKKFWIKGQEFTLPTLLDDKHLAETFGKNPSIAIFRLAPQDYHRYHAPFKAKLGKMFHVPGTYFTVNPQAINEDLNVFTANRRDVQLLQADVRNPTFTAATAATSTTTSTNTPQQLPEPVTFGLVAVGALLVGSIGWSKNPGDSVMKGEDLGFFQYGGSTVILVAPEGTVEWDEDLVANSSGLTGLKGVESGRPLETLVRVGERIGKVVG